MDETGESYIVRIYRRHGGRDSLLVGTVQRSAAGRKWGFTNFEELKAIICRRGMRSAERQARTGRREHSREGA